MEQFIKKHWTTLLGAFFIFMAIGYFLVYAGDQGWISDWMKIAVGIVFGLVLGFIGIKLTKKYEMAGQIITGLSVAVLYATYSFAGIYYEMWNSIVVFIMMIVTTVALSYYAYRFNLRILLNLGLIGAIVSPWIMVPSGDQVFTLFLYLLVINAAFFVLSIHKNWSELRLLSFIGTWGLFNLYYSHFEPEVWTTPYQYLVSGFIFYTIGFLLSSWKQGKNFNGVNFYLTILNGVYFVIWSVILVPEEKTTLGNVIIVLTGLVYILSAYATYRLNKNQTLPIYTQLIGGVILVLLGVADIGEAWDYKAMLNVYVWIFIATVVLFIGQKRNNDRLKLASVVIWIPTVLYWNFVTHDTPMGEIPGLYIPFLNLSALAWLGLAALGFYISLKVKVNFKEINNVGLSYVFGTVSHLIVGGLLYYQIIALWYPRFYGNSLNGLSDSLAVSISWGIYALILFLYGAYTKQNFYRWFGGVVLGIVSLKTIIFDLSGEETIYKMIVLFVLGIISFAISFVNNKWKNEKEN